jgi:hypothetical protein
MFVILSGRIVNLNHVSEILLSGKVIEVRYDFLYPGYNDVEAVDNSFRLDKESEDAKRLLAAVASNAFPK